MERLTMEAGRVVQSVQGRDAGRYFIILQVIDEQFVLMADGLTRKLAHPKKKKVKHLRPKPIMVNVDGATLPNRHLQDSDLRKALADHGLDVKTLAGAEASATLENENGNCPEAGSPEKED
ncbi:MAG: KOW domain-containing RNA-binding protein [Clostridia bacterium]|nr:KOW domain-containing RNA-binding protein [Clostridia bacterium]